MNRVRLAAAVALAALALAVAPAVPAVGAVAASIGWITTSPVQAAFGGNWSARLNTRMAGPGAVPVPGSQATVEVTASGIDEPIATDLPIQSDGTVYVSAPLEPLPPGSYQLTARLIPVSGGYVSGAKTTTPLTLEVSSYALIASASVDQEAGAAPVIELSLSGEYVDSTDSVPAGEWHVTVAQGSRSIVDTTVAQPAGPADPVLYPLTADLDPGKQFSVATDFTPVEAVAAGLDLTQPGLQTFRTPAESLGDVLARPVPYPLWLLILTALVPLGLAAAAIVLTVRLSRRRRPPAGDPSDPVENPVGPVAGAAAVEPVQTRQAPPHEPGAFTQLITPTPLAPEPQDAAPENNWPLSQQDPEQPRGSHLR
ncbi:MAG: hypothetical protein JWP32_2782 [Schumannella sp.]|nr:hypothetical protein [Schumannella sp.]